MMQAVPPPQSKAVIVESATTHQPTIFLGFMGVGDEQSKTNLEKAAAGLGFPAQRGANNKDQQEVMIAFPPASDPTRALDFYRDALAGKFGTLSVEVIIAPVSAAVGGHLDVEKEVTAEPPSSIVVPRP